MSWEVRLQGFPNCKWFLTSHFPKWILLWKMNVSASVGCLLKLQLHHAHWVLLKWHSQNTLSLVEVVFRRGQHCTYICIHSSFIALGFLSGVLFTNWHTRSHLQSDVCCKQFTDWDNVQSGKRCSRSSSVLAGACIRISLSSAEGVRLYKFILCRRQRTRPANQNRSQSIQRQPSCITITPSQQSCFTARAHKMC